MELKLVNWNVKRATPRSPKWRRDGILDGVNLHSPEVTCLTETDIGLLSNHGGHIVYPQIDSASEKMGRKNQRKVLLWSKEPWKQVDLVGHESLRSGRFVSGVTETSIGEVSVVGICIPWANSPGVKGSGVKRWEHHREFLDTLERVLKNTFEQASGKRLIITGDFNQRLGQSYSFGPTHEVREALRKAFPLGISISTKELLFQGERGVNHIAISDDLKANSLSAISNVPEDGKELSDHFGIAAAISVRD